MALAAAVVALLAAGIWAGANLVITTSACRLHEAREGTGYENQAGLTVDEVRRVVWRPFAVKEVRSDAVPPGTVVRISACDAPRGADLVVYINRP